MFNGWGAFFLLMNNSHIFEFTRFVAPIFRATVESSLICFVSLARINFWVKHKICPPTFIIQSDWILAYFVFQASLRILLVEHTKSEKSFWLSSRPIQQVHSVATFSPRLETLHFAACFSDSKGQQKQKGCLGYWRAQLFSKYWSWSTWWVVA